MSKSCSRLAYLRHPALPGIELLIADASVESWVMFHQRYLICGCHSAETTWLYRNKLRAMGDGMTAFMEPGETHRVVTKNRPSHFRALFIEPNEFQTLAEQLGFESTVHFRVAEVPDPVVLNGLQRIAECAEEGCDGLRVQARFYGLMRQVLQYVERRPPKQRLPEAGLRPALNCARDFLVEHFADPVSLVELAATSAVSRFHLARHFAKEFGMPPHAYQVHLRIKNACGLLRAGSSCAEAASTVGFADQSHFTRHFKRIMGVTPNLYARPQLSLLPENQDAAEDRTPQLVELG